MHRGRSIIHFAPQWLTDGTPHRFQMGMSMLCPTHRSHRLEFWFANPGDGDPPIQGHRPLYYRTGGALVELTLVNIGHRGDMLLEFLGCWTGRIIEGVVSTRPH